MPHARHLLFQGDSITNVFRRPEERNDAYRLGSGYPLLVGSECMSIRPDLVVSNRGISGNCLHHVAQRWQTDCIDVAPTHLSLLIGTNDAMAMRKGEVEKSLDRWADRLNDLVQWTITALPDVKILLMEPFQLPGECTDPETRSLCRGIGRQVRRIARQHSCGFLALQSAFDATPSGADWIYDGIHPTARGHWLIAQRWLRWHRRHRWLESGDGDEPKPNRHRAALNNAGRGRARPPVRSRKG